MGSKKRRKRKVLAGIGGEWQGLEVNGRNVERCMETVDMDRKLWAGIKMRWGVIVRDGQG